MDTLLNDRSLSTREAIKSDGRRKTRHRFVDLAIRGSVRCSDSVSLFSFTSFTSFDIVNSRRRSIFGELVIRVKLPVRGMFIRSTKRVSLGAAWVCRSNMLFEGKRIIIW
jgi:hypothetical protein